MALVKGRTCAESCLELLTIELVRFYYSQELVPPELAIEAIGLRVGRQLIERYTASRPRLIENLDVIKFICKEFWQELFKKQVDNLRTNHRGTFVLHDGQFRGLSKLSTGPSAGTGGQLTTNELAKQYLVLPCAVIRGALLHLGLDCTVSADGSNLPACDFTVIIKSR
eukprot:jgi/Botrbrau1/368/Bobra.110_2s0024.1